MTPWNLAQGRCMAKKKYRYAHNPRYCMIRPDAEKPDDEPIIPTGQS